MITLVFLLALLICDWLSIIGSTNRKKFNNLLLNSFKVNKDYNVALAHLLLSKR